MSALSETHRRLLDAALAATRKRGFWRAFADRPFDAGAAEVAVDRLRDRPFPLPGAVETGRLGEEAAAYGVPLRITYPAAGPDAHVQAALAAAPAWAAAAVDARAAVALEALCRLDAERDLLARAIMHTTGAPPALALASTGLQRAVEAVAWSFEAAKRVPSATAHKREGGARIRRRFRLVPVGVALVVGGAASPNDGALPALFADLVAGNPVLVRPDPRAVLPLALVVRALRAALVEAGQPADVVQLCVDTRDAPAVRRLALDPAVRLIDHAGEPGLGTLLRANATQARVRTAPTGPNPVVIDGTDDLAGLVDALALAVALHAGQVPSRPQNLFVPADGIATDRGTLAFEEVAGALGAALDRLLAMPERAAAVCGAVADPATADALRLARSLGRIVRDTTSFAIADFPRARTATPLLLAVEACDEALYAPLQASPVAFLVRTGDTAESIERATHGARARGAVAAAVHSRNDHVLEVAADAFAAAGVPVACNFTGANDVQAILDAVGADRTILDEAFALGRFSVVAEERPARP